MPETTVSVIVTILNGAKWIDKSFESIARQTAVLHHHRPCCEPTSSAVASDVTSSTHDGSVVVVGGNKLKQHDGTQFGGNDVDGICLKGDDVDRIGLENGDVDRIRLENGDDVDGIHLEVCVFDDSSVDETAFLLDLWKQKFAAINVRMRIVRNESGKPKGVGFGRNAAIANSSGEYLCFQDIDDEMLPHRIRKQYALARRHKDAIIGCKFTRIPANSTCRFSRWANELDPQKLSLQIYTSNGPTVIMPTWFCHRSVFDRLPRGFVEDGRGTPEDLIFFYSHLDLGGRVLRVDECLLRYRYHPEATTFSIAAKTIWNIRLRHLIEHVLGEKPWIEGFTIWNAGKQGRRLFRDLPAVEKDKVLAFCDVDKNKIDKVYKHYDASEHTVTHSVPIVHFSEATPPLLICMKLDLTNGVFEENLRSLNLTEGKDFILFT